MNMRKVLATALALVATSTAAFSQTAEVLEKWSIPTPNSREIYPVDPKSDPFSSSAAVEERYVWRSRHFILPNEAGDADLNIRNYYIPFSLGKNNAGEDVEIRGVGQMFAPGVIYNYFHSIYTGPDTALLQVNDPAYIDQFKGAKQFTIDTIVCLFFKNPNQVDLLTASVKFYVWKVPNFTGTGSYQTNGYVGSRSALTELVAEELSQDGMDTTISGTSIHSTVFAFSTPLTFNEKEAAIAMFVNDDLPPVSSPRIDASDTREFQAMRGFFEGLDTNKKRLQLYKNFGMTLYRTVATNPSIHYVDSIRTIWSTLIYGTPPDTVTANLDMGFTFAGTVELSSGVTYRYGTDATSQGLNAVTPNPARETARVNFSLTEPAPVTLDLYNASGEKIRTLVTARYIPGIYSYDLPVSDLQSGTYMVRMTAGEKVYTTKVNVVK